MTNNTKKRTNTRTSDDAQRPSASSSPTDPEGPTLEELLKRNEELERRLRKYKEKQKTTRETIRPIIRPRGEAGNRKRGFILYSAMEMENVENGPVVYDRMRDSVRKACIKVGLNLGAHYKHQDHEKLGQVFLLVRKAYPYLTTARFPHNWAIADMVKGYISGTRKERNRQAREDNGEHDTILVQPKTSSQNDETSDLDGQHSRNKRKKTGDEASDHDDSDDDHHCIKKKKTIHSTTKTKPKKTTTGTESDIDVDEPTDHDEHARTASGSKQSPNTSQAKPGPAFPTKSKKRPRSDTGSFRYKLTPEDASGAGPSTRKGSTSNYAGNGDTEDEIGGSSGLHENYEEMDDV